MIEELEEKNDVNYEIFLIKGIKAFIKEHEKNTRDISIKENLYIKRYYDSKIDTIRYIKSKRNEFRDKIRASENTIRALNITIKELDNERNLRFEKINYRDEINNIDKESLEDIIDAISESKRIRDIEIIRLNDLKEQYLKFNKASLEEENLVYKFLGHIKREFYKEKRKIVNKLNFNNLNDMELILTFDYLTLITMKMICIEEDLLGG